MEETRIQTENHQPNLKQVSNKIYLFLLSCFVYKYLLDLILSINFVISDDKSDIDSKSDDLFLIHFEFNVK